ncbi:hypothetical protein JL107_08965 [Nakamurella flavida]|uniref:Serine hydrolase n=1 Tax=Nakamurella flavida TaxID=363630 RepID=A0A938YF74_9ACTN|nr:hypothetical protein [Nakamurella flavida]MBM9476571.1 hypothetical protein [Nakamurella flavida]MDP9778991.1 hypothetical protein [Nakamurella flavida]
MSSHRGRAPRTTGRAALLAAAMSAALILSPGTATAQPVEPVPQGAAPAPTPAQLAVWGSAAAGARGVEQSVAVLDRATGELVASVGGDEVYNTESVLKLFTAAYYLIQADGEPDADLSGALESLIEVSDNGIQSALWDYDIIPTIVERYGLSGTRNGPNASSGTWGSDRTTADDQVRFLAAAAADPLVGPFLLDTMADTQEEGTDGFDQDFGLNALTGVHGSKQGWSDPGWTPANLHSVGYTARYFVAILQTSPDASYATMRATSTATAESLAALDPPVAPPAPEPALLWSIVLGPLVRWGETLPVRD